MKVAVLAVLMGLAFPVAGFASGYVCESGDGVRVRLYHYNNPKKGTRNPAAFVYSTAAEGTLLTVRGKRITRVNLPEEVEYHVPGNEAVDADTVVLRVRYKEGIDEKAPQTNLPGELSFHQGEERVDSVKLRCLRFLKGRP